MKSNRRSFITKSSIGILGAFVSTSFTNSSAKSYNKIIGSNDRIDLVHKANNRSIFVTGAIDAAVFVSKKKMGFFSMNDLISLK